MDKIKEQTERTVDYSRKTSLFLAISGCVSALIALAWGEFFAALFAPRPGPVIAVANRVIESAPAWFVNFGKNVFGLADKPALIIGTVLITAILGLLFGYFAASNFRLAVLGIVSLGFVGFVSIGTDPQAGWVFAAFCAFFTIASGLIALKFLISKALLDDSESQSKTKAVPGELTRRGFLTWSLLAGGAAGFFAAGAQGIRSLTSAEQFREKVTLPKGDIDLDIENISVDEVAATSGISPLVVPNKDFYLIDTALLKPQVNPDNWSLTINGMVEKELNISYDELLERSTTIAPVTLSCVSNEVGGNLVGNAIWQGVPLVELLDEAGVKPGATQIASRSVDDWTCGFPTEVAYDGRTALVAVGMNGEPLPVRNGFPARLVVSGLYGYVSATKWVEEITLTTLEDFDGYWIPLGWSKLGPVKLQSRIDTPSRRSNIREGEVVPIAGVAWAPNTGISKVEVRIDSGEWEEAKLGESLGKDAWTQWLMPWSAEKGDHIVSVRATDSNGDTQTNALAAPAPSGATGWHTIRISVD